MNLEETLAAMSEEQRKLFDCLKADLEKQRFGIGKDFDDINAFTITRGTDNIADIYSDGRISTCFAGFNFLTPKEKIFITQVVATYVSYRLELE